MPILLEPIARYTRLVLFGKRLLWLLALGLTGVIIAVAWINTEDSSSRIVFSGNPDEQGKPEHSDAAVMVKPRYQGVDENNRPFTVLADRAIQASETTVILEKVSADMTLEDSAWLMLSSDKGRYETSNKTLELKGSVYLFYEGGYEFRTDQALIDVGIGVASGYAPVQGQGPAGNLRSDSFKILDRGQILLFNGHVEMLLFL